MNTTTDPQTASVAPDAPTPIPLLLRAPRKRNGKIAHLPKALRDKINQWIDDGHTYPQIIKALGDDAKDLKPNHFSEWRKGGYQDYLRHQQWRDELRLLRENGADIKEFTDGPQFQETLIQLAFTEIFRVLQQRELKSDSLNFMRILNALARLNREALGLRKYNDLLAKEQPQPPPLELSPEEKERKRKEEMDQIDMLWGIPHPESTAPRPTETQRRLFRQVCERHFGHKGLSHDVQEHNAQLMRNMPGNSVSAGPESQTNPSPQPISASETNVDQPSSPIIPITPVASAPEPVAIEDQLTHHESLVIENQHSKFENETPPIKNQDGRTSLVSKIENCLDCGHPLPPVPPHSLRRPEDHCQNCGVRLPDIGLCYEPGFDHCLNCGATQPHLLPGGERPRPYCHRCGERLHNPEPVPI